MHKKSFASDNFSGVHSDIMQAIIDANIGHAHAYGNDMYTQKATELFKQHFGTDIDAYLVCSGTAANVLGLSTLLKPYQAVICAKTAHLNVDEAGAPEHYIGCKLLAIETADGKITVEDIKKQLNLIGNPHKAQPKIISLTQCTELGTVYTVEELLEITQFAHHNNLYVHMDGARLCNAAAALNLPLVALTKDVGIDLLSFGGTKNGMMFGEAVVFFDKHVSADFKYIRKQGMQLVSKMRFIATQFIALLTNDLWLKNAQQANAMAKLLHDEIITIPEITISNDVQANVVFAQIDPRIIFQLQNKYYFHVWNENKSQVRWMTSFDTTEQDILGFVAAIKQTIASIV